MLQTAENKQNNANEFFYKSSQDRK